MDAAITVLDAGYGQKWYEVTSYMTGPIVALAQTWVIMNKDSFNKLPPDLQQIILEEGAKAELEALRLAAIQNEVGIEKNLREGLELVEFSPEIQSRSENTAITRVIPGWIRRLGGAGHPIISVFNEKVGPLVGLRINPDGSASRR